MESSFFKVVLKPTNQQSNLSQDALLPTHFLNLVVNGIKPQLSDQPIIDHKLTKIEQPIIFMVFITWSWSYDTNVANKMQLILVCQHVPFQLVLCFHVDMAYCTSCMLSLVNLKLTTIFKTYSAVFTSSVNLSDVILEVSF